MNLNVTMSILFLMLQHPITMIIILIMFTISASWETYMMLNNAWYSYILLLTMIGGMMIIFIYMASTSPNKKFSINMLSPTLLIPIYMLMTKSASPMTMQNLNITNLMEMKISNTTMIVGLYLIFTLIVINKIIMKYDSPMRSN